MTERAIAAVVLSFILAGAAPGATIIVDVGGTGDHTTIQAGLDAAGEGDTVLVYPGTYSGAGNRDLTFGTKNLRLRSTGGPDVTIIDVQNLAGHRGFNFYDGGQDSTCVVRGFTVRRARVMQTSPGPGAGIRCEMNTSPTFANLIIEDNVASATWGGGMYCNNGASPLLVNVRFEGNSASGGGGLYCNMASSPTLYGVEFVENAASGTYGRGGGLYCTQNSDVAIIGATFVGNTCGQHGGAVYCWRANPSLNAVTFAENYAAVDGGALYVDDNSSPTIQGATFFANSADGTGGAYAAVDHSNPTLLTSIFAFTGVTSPRSSAGPAPMPTSRARGTAFYCDGTSVPTIRWACTFGNTGGDALCGGVSDTLMRDPLFCDLTADDLTLASNSPCLEAGNPWTLQIGAHGQGCVNSPVTQTSWGRIKALYGRE